MARLKAKVNEKWITGDNAQQLVNNALAAHHTPVCGKSFRDYANHFIALYKAQGSIAQSTLVGYKGYLKNHILPALGDMDLKDITVDTVQTYINGKASACARKTLKEHITLAAEIMDGALEDGWIAKNPFRSSRLKIIGQESTVVEAFTVDEYHLFEQEILPILPTSAKLFAAITLYTGMRRGEICALRWEDIDFSLKRIHVTKAISWPGQNQGILKQPKTHNGVRHPIIILPLLVILLQYRKEQGYVIQGERAKEDAPITRQGIKRLYERIDRAVTDSGCGIDFHSINRRGRHTIATFMNNAALDEKTIESQLGHYDVRFTRQRYMNAQARQEEKSMAQLAEYIAQI